MYCTFTVSWLNDNVNVRNKGTCGLMLIYGIIITKQFACISHWNFKRLRGSDGRAHMNVGYIFLKSGSKPQVNVFLLKKSIYTDPK